MHSHAATARCCTDVTEETYAIGLTVPERASASQLMAAVESRELVGAAPLYEHPDAPESADSPREREHKAEQHLETRPT
jgi:hypothetical protein